jgi:hypothetical protein
MAAQSLVDRVAALEAEVAALKQLANAGKPKDWLDVVYGSFAGDPTFDEATRLGREWRESFRPKSPKRKKAANGRARHRSSKSSAKNK